MKKDIHPAYHKKAKVRCACGAEFEVGSTSEEIKTEICSRCHPAYTGNKKLVDTAGRLDRFQERLNKTKKIQEKIKEQAARKKSAQAKNQEPEDAEAPSEALTKQKKKEKPAKDK